MWLCEPESAAMHCRRAQFSAACAGRAGVHREPYALRPMSRRVLVCLLLLTLVVASGASGKPKPKPKAPSDPLAWTSYGYDNQLRNAVPSSLLTLRSVTRLASAWKVTLDGPVYASPLSARVAGRQAAHVATQAGSV